jgi:hypothetical protein
VIRRYYIYQRHAAADKIMTQSHKSRGKINSYATLLKNKFPQTGLDVSTSFTTSDKNTCHTHNSKGKNKFPIPTES